AIWGPANSMLKKTRNSKADEPTTLGTVGSTLLKPRPVLCHCWCEAVNSDPACIQVAGQSQTLQGRETLKLTARSCSDYGPEGRSKTETGAGDYIQVAGLGGEQYPCLPPSLLTNPDALYTGLGMEGVELRRSQRT
ncbi:mCG145011, partial [Mus musculus]